MENNHTLFLCSHLEEFIQLYYTFVQRKMNQRMLVSIASLVHQFTPWKEVISMSETMKLLANVHPAFRRLAPKYNNSTRVIGTVPSLAQDAKKRPVVKYTYTPSW